MAWIGEIILDRSCDPKEPTVVEVGDLTFYADGTVRLGNRAFKKNRPIDYHYGGYHAFRDRGSKRLTIWTTAEERYVFEFRGSLAGGRWIRWTPQGADELGTPDADALASRRDRLILGFQDVVANLQGAVGWLVLGFALLGLLFGLLGIGR